MSDIVSYKLEHPICTITLDDGKVNCLSPQMLDEINAALDRAEKDDVAVVLTGREGKFSAGFDLGVLGKGGNDAVDLLIDGFRLAERLLSFPMPVVVACTGHALAMGSFLLLSADYRIGADGAHKIGANEVSIGMTMPRFGVEICRQRLAPAHFHRAVILAEIYSPHTAVEAGFLDQVVPADELMAAARDKATALTRLSMPAHTATKLRARDEALQAVRKAIEADEADLRS